jgi:hypothetical protein
MLEKTNQSPFKDQEEADRDEQERAASNERNRRKAMNFEKIGDRSICVIFLLTEYLLRNNMSLFTLYDGKIYDQLVKTKTKESVVEIIQSQDFFNIIKGGIVSETYLSIVDDTKVLTEGEAYQTVEEDLQLFLCLDQNYKNLLLIKKVTKFIDELTIREDLREQALRVLPDDLDFNDLEEEINAYDDENNKDSLSHSKNKLPKEQMFSKGRNMIKNPYGGGERLNTIEEEEKQYETQSIMYKTGDRKDNISNGAFTKSNLIDRTFSKGGLSEAEAFNKSD